MKKACAVVDKHSSLLSKGVGLNEAKFYRHERWTQLTEAMPDFLCNRWKKKL